MPGRRNMSGMPHVHWDLKGMFINGCLILPSIQKLLFKYQYKKHLNNIYSLIHTALFLRCLLYLKQTLPTRMYKTVEKHFIPEDLILALICIVRETHK